MLNPTFQEGLVALCSGSSGCQVGAACMQQPASEPGPRAGSLPHLLAAVLSAAICEECNTLQQVPALHKYRGDMPLMQPCTAHFGVLAPWYPDLLAGMAPSEFFSWQVLSICSGRAQPAACLSFPLLHSFRTAWEGLH